jgi:UDP-3-O-[3-hydroxymyristoyl] glucosamine N-acyltransferase
MKMTSKTAVSGDHGDRTFTLGELAERIGADLRGAADIRVVGVAPLDEARPDEVSFVGHPRYAPLAAVSRAAALIVDASCKELERPLLLSNNPHLTFARAAALFAKPPRLAAGVHDTAYTGPGIVFGDDVAVGPLAHVGADCQIGPRTLICGGAYLGDGVVIGADCIIHSRVVILDACRIGDRVIVNSGAVIGSDGFGFVQDEQGHHFKIPQMGIVQIDDDVEIGANSTIDRATLGKTWIRKGTKIDNMVHIAHNVVVGEHCLLVAQVGIAGSTQLGNHVVIAGQTGVLDHVTIGDRARVAAKSAVAHSIKAGEDMAGIPAVPIKEWMRTYGNFRRLSQFRNQLKELAEKVKELEQAMQGNSDD